MTFKACSGESNTYTNILCSAAVDGTSTDSIPSTAGSDTGILVYSNEDDDELMAFAFAAGGAMDEESDTELFSVSIPSPSPADIYIGNPSMSPIYTSQRTPEKMDETRQINDTCTNVNLVDRKERGGESTHEKTSKQGMIC